jgi:two-component system sensor histidine kinase KdpD
VQNLLETRFMYTTLRSSTVLAREGTREGRRLTRALLVEQDTVERLEDLDDLKDTLLQTVSHDLRNPISAVLLLTSMLAADARGAQPLTVEKKLEIIDKVEFTAEKMGDLLRDLLDSDPMQKNAELYRFYDVGELVERVLAGVDLARNHPVETDLGSVITNIDPAHVERMVENLLTNAARHVPPGVPVWVKTAGSAAGGVLISVEDAGPGIVPEIAARVFQPSRCGTHNGSERLSLGLSLVSRFAQLHGGKAWLEERPGGGSAFRIFLPPPTPTPPDTDLGTTFPGTPLGSTNGERHHRPR